MEGKIVVLFLMALLGGIVGGFGLSYIAYQPQVQNNQNTITNLQNQVANLNSTLEGLLNMSGALAQSIGELEARTLNRSTGPSYIISQMVVGEDTYVCMQNGTTGKLDYCSLDSSAVFNACTGNLTDGGTILIKGGHYVMTASFLVGDNTSVEGEGVATELVLGTGLVCPVVSNLNTTTGNMNITLRNFKINGNEDGVGASANYTTSGVRFARVNDSRIEDMYIENCWASCIRWDAGSSRNLVAHNTLEHARFGVFFSGDGFADKPSSISISNNFVRDVHGTAGIHGNGIFVMEGTNVVIDGNQVAECIDSGCEVHGCNYSTISDNVLNNNCKGILVRESYHVTVNGNSIYDTVFGKGSCGIWILGADNAFPCRDITVSGNAVYYTKLSSVRIENAIQVTVIGNTFDTTLATGEEGISVYLAANANVSGCAIIVANNIVRNATGQGIYVGTNGTYMNGCVIEGNTVFDCEGDGIRLGHVENSIVNGNVCHDNGGYGLSEAASNYNTYIGNNCYANTFGDFVDGRGPYSKVAHNMGDPQHDT